MEKYIGAYGEKFNLIKNGLKVNVGDTIAPQKNKLVKCLVESVDGNKITLTLVNKDTFIPSDYLEDNFDWEVISTISS